MSWYLSKRMSQLDKVIGMMAASGWEALKAPACSIQDGPGAVRTLPNTSYLGQVCEK